VSDHGGWKTTKSPDRGRGLDLMHALMDAVDVEAGDGGSTVRLHRRLQSPSAGVPVAGGAGAAT